MKNRSKLLFTALTAALVMAASVSSASARAITTSSQNFRMIWTPLSFTALGGLIQFRCNLTLRGSFHYRTIQKTRSLIGYVTSAAFTRPCTGGEAWILNGTERPTNSLPWHILYDSFTGTLPRIRSARVALVGADFLLIALGNSCLYASTAASPMFFIASLNEATGQAESLSADNTSRIPLSATLAGSCPASISFAGTASTFDNGEGARLTVRLI